MGMKIKMTATRLGADDGVTVKSYEKGETYDVSNDLGNDLVAGGYAEEAKAAPEKKAAESKKSDDKKGDDK